MPANKVFRDRLSSFDLKVDLAFDRLRGRRSYDLLFYGASAVGDHGILWVLVSVVRGVRPEHRRRAKRTIIATGIESVLVNLLFKSLFRRHRPEHNGPRPLPLRIPRTSSFPSGHTTAAFCAAALLAENDPLWPAYYVMASVVAASRIYVRIHHPSDVLAGIAVGTALGHIGRRISPLERDS
ncbi:MAG: phosphatase PAP2 family protein [Actinomycetota bacterium]|nr:phosphatase PAP2 family protein [Actinomycetota bacterium]